ncbi:NF-X1-type zinc finger protein NFXL1 [Chrysoperla carnea]|uniref:NF-X1-type zinc finger protein NFXL1 n=1 Tax=Chrysoperla carnea TaxID=189513 RepID=UPI001D096BB5|nr:NF-X1-type zinc finger protein NFXL1 [Chrysoperla carnea]
MNKNTKEMSAAERKFKAVQEKMQQSAKKYTQDYESSSEEEELESNKILDKILEKYIGFDSTNNLGRTQQFLEESLVSGTQTCLICIGSVKRVDAIWSCIECYSFFHLLCIQRWSKDSIVSQKRIQEDQNNGNVSRNEKYYWCCPKCRHEYTQTEIPTDYKCFCSKKVNPTYQLWQPPHSCGEICGKFLVPNCNHKCLLLCHPGPCPPCPQTTNTYCHCGKEQCFRRCSNKLWSCGSKCGAVLSCGRHNCTKKCHDGPCPPCPKQSQQKCECQRQIQLRECASPKWQCEEVCNKILDCKKHKCEVKCHAGSCEPCPLTKPRVCSCGKQQYILPCTEETPTCGDTCGKLLECGQHQCLQRCHRDKCGNCLEVVFKVCRCGFHKKELPCQKEYLCDTKCKNIKDCQKHSCNRKCCDGNCPPCEKPCGRGLRCGYHKCTSTCHQGPCYPCRLTVKIKCRCGRTTIEVPCGRQRKTKPPRCSYLCKNRPDCHHKQRVPHACHFGDCPPCKQICGKPHENCDHTCPALCHSAVLVHINEDGEKISTPWDKKNMQIARTSLPCPDCTVPVQVTCLGEHESIHLPCYRAKSTTCGRQCGRLLACGNHTCTFKCHVVAGSDDNVRAGSNCEKCELGCLKKRPEGCIHPCPKPCHADDCAPCKQMLRPKCHCGLTQVYVRCYDLLDPEKVDILKSCGNRCPKNYKCGHRCKANCHAGECPDEEKCNKKVKITCECKGIKREFHCESVRKGEAKIDCNAECRKKLEESKKLLELQEKQRKEEEERKNQKELEEYQKKFQSKKKYKERKQFTKAEEVSFLRKYWWIFLALTVFFGIFLVLYKYL